MNKTKRAAFVIAAIVLCAAAVLSAAVFTACGAKGYFVEPEKAVYLTRAGKLTALDGYTVRSGSGRTRIVVKEGTGTEEDEYGLYDFVAGKFVVSPSSDEITNNGGVFIRSAEGTDGTVTYEAYTATQRIGGSDEMPDVVSVSRTHTRADIGNDTYFVDRETGAFEKTKNPLAKYIATGAEYETDKYLIAESSDSNVYDYYDADTFEYIRTTDAACGMPLECDDLKTFVLSNGDIAAQATVEVPADSENIDKYEYGAAYDIVTHIIDAGSGKHKNKDVSFVIINVRNSASSSSFDKLWDCDNIASVTLIDEDTLSPGSKTLVALGNGLGVDYDFSEFAGVNVPDSSVIYYLGGDKIVIGYDLYDGSGKLLASDIEPLGDGYFGKAFGNTIKVYDSDLEEVYSRDVAENGMPDFYVFGDRLVVVEKSSSGTCNVRVVGGSSMSVDTFGGTYMNAYGVFTATGSDGKYMLCSIGEGGGINTLVTSDDAISINGSYTDENGEFAGLIVTSGTAIYAVTEV